MKAKKRRVMPKGNLEYVRALESTIRRFEKELARERRSTDKYAVCLREQLDRSISERDEFKRQYERAIDQLISLTGRSPISDEAVQAPAQPQQVVDNLFASVFGEDEGNNLFPRVPIEIEAEEEKVQ